MLNMSLVSSCSIKMNEDSVVTSLGHGLSVQGSMVQEVVTLSLSVKICEE